MIPGKITATRYHDFSAGHRVAGHENKCSALHGHNYRVHFTCAAEELDHLGRVIDFGVIKTRLCDWVEEFWDHRFLMWDGDELLDEMTPLPGLAQVPFNPTAENMAEYLLTVVGPMALKGTGVLLVKVMIEETRKCSAEAAL